MNRRQVVVASLGLVPVIHRLAPLPTQISTPTAASMLPALPSDISPVQLTDEVELLYFRSVVLGSHVQFVGELRNTADYWVAAPSWILNSGSGVKAQPTMLHGDIPPGGREQFSHGFFEELTGSERADALKLTMDTVDHEFCDIGGSLSIYNDQMDLQINTEDLSIDLDRPAFRAKVEVTNLGEIPTDYVNVSALFFDDDGYYCGALTSLENARLKSNESIIFEIEEGFNSYSTAGNPLELINASPVVVIQAGWFAIGSLICV